MAQAYDAVIATIVVASDATSCNFSEGISGGYLNY